MGLEVCTPLSPSVRSVFSVAIKRPRVMSCIPRDSGDAARGGPMRVWDLDPGYLDRGALLGEHAEIHALLAVLARGTGGYAHHPETLRWRRHRGALARRHDLDVAELALRGYRHASPAPGGRTRAAGPGGFLDEPAAQLVLLRDKYARRGGTGGRIPLPRNAQELWAQHKYSVLARDPARYRELGRTVAALGRAPIPAPLVLELVHLLRQAPAPGRLRNALEHLWGYVSDPPEPGQEPPGACTAGQLLGEIRRRALARRCEYLVHSTALSELVAWV